LHGCEDCSAAGRKGLTLGKRALGGYLMEDGEFRASFVKDDRIAIGLRVTIKLRLLVRDHQANRGIFPNILPFRKRSLPGYAGSFWRSQPVRRELLENSRVNIALAAYFLAGAIKLAEYFNQNRLEGSGLHPVGTVTANTDDEK
jgi:hypothetical protein